MEQSGIRVNGEKASDPKAALKVGETYLLQVGKRGFARVNLVPAGSK
jgi:tyrosyl-tRNA synthetase